MITIFDSHFHFYGEQTPEEFCRQLPPGWRFELMAVGANLTESHHARAFAHAIPGSWFACGVHPHSAEEFTGKAAEEFAAFRGDPKLAAIGELGLDYFYDFAPRSRQRQVFEEFLALALAWQLPAIVHCRDAEARFDAYEDAHTLLRDFANSGGRFVVHCFAGTPEWAERFLALGAWLGVTGIVTFNKAVNIRETLRVIPPDRLLLETDSPYLAPIPYRGKTNHPAYLVEVAKRVASEQCESLEATCERTTANAHRFFGLPE